MMNKVWSKYKLRQNHRQLITVSIIIALAIYFLFCRGPYSTNHDALKPINHHRFTLEKLSDATTNVTLVVASTASEDTTWIGSDFPNITTAVYVVDTNNSSSSFKTPINKGNEAMVYLTYIINTYNDFPDIAIFTHAHLQAKHTDDLLGNSIVESLQRLRLSKIQKHGYFNLRCNWKPGGCPRYLNLHDPTRSAFEGSAEAQVLKTAWSELFPGLKEVPEWVSQPYGGQFATTRDAIHKIPLQSWVRWREWLINTDLSDYHSGRVWEYTWQYVLAGEANFCPDMYQCYCEGYGVCFRSSKAFREWTERGEKLEEDFSKYLLAGQKSIEMKTKLMKERATIDAILKEAKDRGDSV